MVTKGNLTEGFMAINSSGNPYLRWERNNTMYQIVYANNTNQWYTQKSTDGGSTWTSVDNGYRATLMYYPGTTLSNESLPCFGFITSAGQEIYCYCFFYKSIQDISSITLTSFIPNAVRISTGGYMAKQNDNIKTYYSNNYKWGGHIWLLRFKNTTSGFTWGTNNTTFAGSITFSGTLN